MDDWGNLVSDLNSARFGFLTEADAWRWFGDEGVMALLDAGFDLVEVEATEVYVSYSGRQVMYCPAAVT